MKRLLVGLALCELITSVAQAAQVTLTLPDAKLQAILTQMREWYHCGTLSDDACIQHASESMIQMMSLGHYGGLEDVQATVAVTRGETP